MEISKFRLQVSKVLRSERTRASEDFAAALRRTAVFLKRLPGHFSGRFIRPLIGFGFDLGGGIYRVDGCQFEIPVHLTDRNYRSAFVLGEYEAAERRLIRRFLRPDDQVIEMGGCIGVLSCLVNSRLTFPTRHLVVEPNPEVIPWLKRHRQLNRAGFKIEQCAVSTQSEVEFAIHRFMTHGSISARGGASVVQVPGRSLADLHKSFGPFNVLLMDVEGHELKILAASQDLLREYRLVIVELHPETLGANGMERCEDILRSSGLQRAARIHFSEAWVRSSPARS